MEFVSWVIICIFLFIAGGFINFKDAAVPVMVFEFVASATIIINLLLHQITWSELVILLVGYPVALAFGYATMGVYMQNRAEYTPPPPARKETLEEHEAHCEFCQGMKEWSQDEIDEEE